MEYEEFAAAIDHTVLGPETTPTDVETVLDEAAEYGLNACVPPYYVDEADDYAPGVTLATVVGFPHGQNAPAIKAEEAEAAWNAGADEIDVVVNLGRLRAGDDEAVRRGVEAVVAATPLPVKVIVEAPLLAESALRRACEAARDADADMVKTATGFSEGGATVEDVGVMSEYLPVKASGGVGSYAEATELIEAGAERIGASSGVAIARGHPDAPE